MFMLAGKCIKNLSSLLSENNPLFKIALRIFKEDDLNKQAIDWIPLSLPAIFLQVAVVTLKTFPLYLP